MMGASCGFAKRQDSLCGRVEGGVEKVFAGSENLCVCAHWVGAVARATLVRCTAENGIEGGYRQWRRGMEEPVLMRWFQGPRPPFTKTA
jgi:hypothetical protein